MELAISFAQLDPPQEALRQLDSYFSVFEGTAWLLSAGGNADSLAIDLPCGDRAHVDLHPEFPCLELTAGDESPEADPARWRIWRPPLEVLPPEDREWIERRSLLRDRRSPPVAARFDARRGWCDPDDGDLRRLCGVLDEVTGRLVAERGRAA